MIDLDEIERRANAATPAPWTPPTERERGPGCDDRACVVDHEGCAVWPWHRREDMEFAYAARVDVPALIARVRELEAERDEARKARTLADALRASAITVEDCRAVETLYAVAGQRGSHRIVQSMRYLGAWLGALPRPGEP